MNNRKIFTIYLLLLLCLIYPRSFILNAANNTWENVGNAGFNQDEILGENHYSMAVNPINNQPYVAFSNPRLTVMTYNGSSWENVGDANFSTSTANYPSIAFDPISGDPYVAYKDADASSNITVMKFNGSEWETVGSAGFGAVVNSDISLAFNSSTNEPYVAFNVNVIPARAEVMKFNGLSWESVGSSVSSDNCWDISMKFNPVSNEPYVVSRNNTPVINVAKFNGSDWENVGDLSLIFGRYPSIDFHPSTNEPYVAFEDTWSGENKVTVIKFNGSDWENVGNAKFTPVIENVSILFNSSTNEPYVFYKEDSTNKASVMRYHDGSWINVGEANFSNNILGKLFSSFDTSKNEPYILYKDEDESGKLSVMKYTNKSESPLPSVSGGTYASSQSVALITTTDGASIYYTTNGSTPTTGSTLYSSPITISEDTTLKAIAVKDGMADSELMTEEYIININEDPEEESTPVYRFYSPTGKSHFFTTSSSEKNRIIANYSNDWRYEGIAYYSYASSNSGLSPIYRFYSPTGKSHFFTKSESEKNNVIANYSNDWNYEGIAYYAYSSSGSGLKPVYRFYSPAGRSHFFTNSESEKNNVITKYSNDWRYEGISWYVPE